MRLFKIFMAVVLIAVLSGCRSHMNVSDHYSYTNFKTSVVNVSPSGMLTVRAWGSGPDKRQAIETAMKNAVSDLIFTGIKGASGYAGQAIVT